MKNEILSRVIDHLKNRFPGEPATVQDLVTLATAIAEEIAAIPRPAESIRRHDAGEVMSGYSNKGKSAGGKIIDESGGEVGKST